MKLHSYIWPALGTALLLGGAVTLQRNVGIDRDMPTIAALAAMQQVSGDTFYMRADGTASQANSERQQGGKCSDADSAMSASTYNSGSLSPGDVVVFCDDGGPYRATITTTSPGKADSLIYHIAAPGDNPQILGSEDRSDTGDWSDNGSNRWRTLGSTTANSDRLMIWRDGVQLNSQSSLGAVDAADEYYWDASTDSVYLYGTSNPGSDASIYEVAIRGFGLDLRDDYNSFDGIDVFYAWNQTVRIYAGDDTIRNYTFTNAEVRGGYAIFHDGGNDGVFIDGTLTNLDIQPGNDNFGGESFRGGIGSARSGVVNYRVIGLLIDSVDIDSATNDGIGLEWADSTTISNVNFTGAYGENCIDMKDPVFITVTDTHCRDSKDAGYVWHDEQVSTRAHHLTMRRVIFDSVGWDYDIGAFQALEGTDFDFDSVVLRDVGAHGINIYGAGADSIILDRIIIDGWATQTSGRHAIWLNSPVSPKIRHATIYAQGSAVGNAIEMAGTVTGTVELKNNIVLENSGGDIGACVAIGGSPTMDADFNLYWYCDDTDFYYNGTGYNLSGWQSAISDGDSSRVENPELRNPTNAEPGDLSLHKVSPAIGRAEDVGVHDDIGAFDYQTPTEYTYTISSWSWVCADSITTHATDSDIWPFTWDADGYQYGAWGDGNGFLSTRYGRGVAQIGGTPTNITDSTHVTEVNAGGGGPYNTGLISIGDTVWGLEIDEWTPRKVRVIRSTDWSAWDTLWTWNNSPENPYMFVQMGKSYRDSIDSYIYMTSEEPTEYNPPDSTVYLMRAPVGSISDSLKWEIFTGTAASPAWDSLHNGTPASLKIVGGNPDTLKTPTITYWPDRDLFIMLVGVSYTNYGHRAVYQAPKPWGPWTEVDVDLNFCGKGSNSGEPLQMSVPTAWMTDSLVWVQYSAQNYDGLQLFPATVEVEASATSTYGSGRSVYVTDTSRVLSAQAVDTATVPDTSVVPLHSLADDGYATYVRTSGGKILIITDAVIAGLTPYDSASSEHADTLTAYQIPSGFTPKTIPVAGVP